MSKDRFLPQNVRQIPQVGCTRPHMQPQQLFCGVSTDFGRFITHHAPLEPISVVRFARYYGRRYHSPQQLRCVPLPVDVGRTETSDKRAPGGISCMNTDFTPIETMHRGATPQSMSLKRLAVFDLSSSQRHDDRWSCGSKSPVLRPFRSPQLCPRHTQGFVYILTDYALV